MPLQTADVATERAELLLDGLIAAVDGFGIETNKGQSLTRLSTFDPKFDFFHGVN